MEISTRYEGDLRFSDSGAVPVVMDAPTQGGGKGEAPSPKQMVLHGLAGCTGLDVVAILGKKKVAFEDFRLEVTAEQTRHHPKVFKAINLVYRFVANPDDRPAIERAVTLSKENFCGVSAMLEKSATIEHEVIIETKAT